MYARSPSADLILMWAGPLRGDVVRAVAFTGMPGSGKSVAVDVARRMGLPVFRMGDVVWEEVRARGLGLAEGSVGRVANEMREQHGPGIWADRTLERIRKTDAPLVVIDGVRSPAEIDAFRAALGHDFHLVALHASQDTRLERLLARHREDDVKDPEQFHGRDDRELAWGLGRAIALADAMIVNEGGIPDLEAQVEAVLRRFQGA